MVPEVFHDYFVASTGAGAALVGLLFVAVSIAPERTVMSGILGQRMVNASWHLDLAADSACLDIPL